MNLESNNEELHVNADSISINAAEVTINGEAVDPNEPVTISQTENVDITITDNKPEPGGTLEENEEKLSVSEVEASYVNNLVSRIIASGRSGKLRVVGVHEDDFTKIHAAGFIERGMHLRNTGMMIVIYKNADTTGTFWDRSGE